MLKLNKFRHFTTKQSINEAHYFLLAIKNNYIKIRI